MTKVSIYSNFDAFYYSFYIQGIVEYFGETNVEFSYKDFPPLPNDCLAFVINEPENFRIIIDAYDGALPNDFSGLEWCDVYGKVNLVSSIMPHHLVHKCRAIGPSFPIQVWPLIKTCWLALRHYSPAISRKAAREHFANYFRQYRYRLPIEEFVPGPVKDRYVFFSSTIWTEDEAPGTNQSRALFMQTCKSMPGLTFEGGFSPPPSADDAKTYKEHIAPKRYPFPEWLEKTRSSALAFNTPAVFWSHTFKPAEFLALGKAIISTTISRELPAPLVHGQHVHYVDGSIESLRDAVTSILRDRDYRMHLERNALEYYLTYLRPKRVIERLLHETPSAICR